MSTEAWDLLVRRLEVKARQRPRAYRLRVAALAALGYAFIGGALLVAAGGLVGTLFLMTRHPLAVKLLFVFGPLAWVILRALPVKLEPPTGIELFHRDAPELFALIEQLRKKVSAPRVHRLLVDGELNASVAQVPRFGWFGPARNYLVVGLPLLQALDPDEFRAVVAHELGHVSRRHGRFSAWVYRIRETWGRILTSLEQNGHWGAGVFRRFFRWYVPYFSAFSFVLAREHEYEADRAAAEAAGAETAATALARLDLFSRYLGESYWPAIYREAEHARRPSARPLVALTDALRSAGTGDEVGRFVGAALAERTGTADTHPSLTDRLTSLEVAPTAAVNRAAKPTSESAADRFLGSFHGDLAERLDAEWRDAIGEWWEDEHRQLRAARARLAELDGSPDQRAPDALLEHAQLVEHFRGDDDALPLYRGVLEREAENAVANFAVGRMLLEHADEAGLRYLDLAANADREAIVPACRLAAAFLAERERIAEADQYLAQAAARLDALDDAYEERHTLREREKLGPAELPAEVVEDLVRQLAAYPQVKHAYFAKRVFAHLDDEFPSYVLGVKLRIVGRRLPKESQIQRLANELRIPVEFFVINLDQAGKLKKRIRKVENARIYTRGR